MGDAHLQENAAGQPGAPRVAIRVCTGGAAPWQREFEQSEISLGRGAEADVRLHPQDTLCASRVHARLKWQDGQLWLTVEHVNGVVVRSATDADRFLGQGEKCALGSASELELGRGGPLLRCERPEAEIPATLKGTQAARWGEGALQPLVVDILSGYASPWTGRFVKPVVTIGRDPSADIRLHPTKDTICASRIHARVERTGARSFRLVVEHASGVTVEPDAGPSVRVLPGQPVDLAARFSLVIGEAGPRIAFDGEGSTGTLVDRALGADVPLARVSPTVVAHAASGRRRGAIAMGASVALAIAGLGLWQWTNRGFNDLRAQRDAEIAKLEDEQRSLAAALARGPSDRLSEELRRVARSVHLIGYRSSTGSFVPCGTGWTIAPGVLATNAHVVQALPGADKGEPRGVVRLRGEAGAERETTAAFPHPGFKPWLDRLTEQAARSGGAHHAELIAFCDAALLHVAGGDLGPPLHLAPAREGLARPGDPVGAVGFPVEGLAGLPVAQTLTGHITATTDYFFDPAPGEQAHLFHHSITVAGGASGMPIINQQGEVVAILSAGSTGEVMTPQGGTRRVSAGINYGQTIDLLRELLEQRAPTAQRAREAAWPERLARFEAKPEQRLAEFVADAARRWGAEPERIVARSVTLTGTPARATLDVPIEAGGQYVVLATPVGWSPLTLALGAADQVVGIGRTQRGVASVALSGGNSPTKISAVVTSIAEKPDPPEVLVWCLRARN